MDEYKKRYILENKITEEEYERRNKNDALYLTRDLPRGPSTDRKRYYIRNRDVVMEIQRKYKESHAESIKKVRAEYNDRNRDRLKGNKSLKMTCGCGAIVSCGNIYNHRKSLKHKEYAKTQ